MNVITEADLRVRFTKDKSKTLCVGSEDYLTGPARDYIREQRLTVEEKHPDSSWTPPQRDFPGGFVDEQGVRYAEKPEHLTHLHGRVLVEKTHPRIALRGRLDSLQARILETQVTALEAGRNCLVDDLQETLDYVRAILSAEVREVPFSPQRLLGYTEGELQDISHHPEQHLGCGHFLPSCQMGWALVALNSLRTGTRETELCAAHAFPGGEQPDLIRSLNRLSSAFYVMMCREKSGNN